MTHWPPIRWLALTTTLLLLAGCASSSTPSANHDATGAAQQADASQTATAPRAAANKKDSTSGASLSPEGGPLAEAPVSAQGPSTSGSAGDVDISREVLTQSRDGLLLAVAGKHHRATAAFACNDLSGTLGWRCLSTVADDTIHVTEFEHRRVITKHEQFQLFGAQGKAATNVVRVGSGSPEQMHRDGYAHVVEAKLSAGGTLKLPAAPASSPYLVFAVARVRPDWLVKYVWVIDRPTGGPP